MIAINSLARRKEGVLGEEEVGGQTGTLTAGADAPTGLSRSGVLDARNSLRAPSIRPPLCNLQIPSSHSILFRFWSRSGLIDIPLLHHMIEKYLYQYSEIFSKKDF